MIFNKRTNNFRQYNVQQPETTGQFVVNMTAYRDNALTNEIGTSSAANSSYVVVPDFIYILVTISQAAHSQVILQVRLVRLVFDIALITI